MDPFTLIDVTRPAPDAEEYLPVAADEFAALPLMQRDDFGRALAVALSGGPDSMALLALLYEWAQPQSIDIHAVTVDHALRPESAAEAQQVKQNVNRLFPAVTCTVLRRDLKTIMPTRLQEEARHDRYDLLRSYCQQHNIPFLFLAHHQDDQAETFLFRLCKGSGLDGLAAMRPVVPADQAGLMLCRPLLAMPKERLVATCRSRNVTFVTDPSNRNERFARVRLRRLMEGLALEGLSPRRMAATAARLARSSEALTFYTDIEWQKCLSDSSGKDVVLDWQRFQACPQDIRVRLLLRALKLVGGDDGYGPRLERVEEIEKNMANSESFTRMTFYHCVIERSVAQNRLSFRYESA